MNKWSKRVYGLIGVSCKMANWNADFTGNPKTISDGKIFGSDKALKYSMKRYWKNQGEDIMYIKSYKIGEKEGKLQPKMLSERYAELFNKEIGKKTNSQEVIANLFSAIDVMNFGATFAEEGQNISITGAVQIGQGLNKYVNTNIEVQDILSPFRNSKKEEADASSLGTKIVVDEAHYFYPFSINPRNYDEYIGLIDSFVGYTEEAYQKFKEAALVGATALNTNSKSGCYNSFALFITCKEDANVYLPHLDGYMEFSKEDGQNIVNLQKTTLLLEEFKDEIETIEVFLNPYMIKIEGQSDDFILKNIFTRGNL